MIIMIVVYSRLPEELFTLVSTYISNLDMTITVECDVKTPIQPISIRAMS